MVNFLFRIIWIHWRRHQGGWRLTEVSRLKGDKDRNLLFRQKLKRLKIKYWCQNILLNFSSRLTNDSLELHNLIESLYEQHLWHFFCPPQLSVQLIKSATWGQKHPTVHRLRPSDCSPRISQRFPHLVASGERHEVTFAAENVTLSHFPP